MKKILTIVFSALFVSGITAHHFNWENHFTNTELKNLFGYQASQDDYFDDYDLFLDTDILADDYQFTDLSAQKTITTDKAISVWVKNRNLIANERYVLSCRAAGNSVYENLQAVNYDEPQFRTYNRSKILTIYNATPNTSYTCSVSIQEEYKSGFWRVAALGDSVAVKTNGQTVNADGTINVAGGKIKPPVNVMSRRFSTDRGIIRAMDVLPKPKEWRVVGPRYYQNEVLKNWLSTGPVYSKPIMR